MPSPRSRAFDHRVEDAVDDGLGLTGGQLQALGDLLDEFGLGHGDRNSAESESEANLTVRLP
jgi:hypothetical protein